MFPKLAALDLGSNSFHLAIFELLPDGSFVRSTRAKEKVQLGRACFETGRVDQEAFQRGLAAVRSLRGVVDAQQPQAVLAVATSALREAGNGADFVRQASVAAGFPIRIISGQEEARLVWLGTTDSMNVGQRRIAILDLGGGSTEVILGDAHRISLARSLPLGTLRLRSQWAAAGAERTGARWLEQRARDLLAPSLREVAELGFDELVLSCGSARDLLAMVPALAADRGASSEHVLTGRALELLRAHLQTNGSAAPQAERLWVAAIVLQAALACLGVESATVSRASLREGLIADYLGQCARASGVSALAV